MKEWCMEHWFLTFVIIIVALLLLEAMVCNLCNVVRLLVIGKIAKKEDLK